MAKKAKNNEVDMDNVFSDIAQECGGTVMADLETSPFNYDCGNLAVNYSCAGKFIGGGVTCRITEVYGPEGSAKSLFASNCLASCQRMDGYGCLLDCENASNSEFMSKISGVNLKRIIRLTPPTLERAFRSIHNVTAKIRERERTLGLDQKPILFVFDSLTVPPCERELRENDLPMDYTVADWKKIVGRKEQPGERAKVVNAEMRKLQSMVAKENVSVFIINQTRDKIGIMFGNPETPGGGGNAVKFYSSLRMRTQAKKKIEHKTNGSFSGINLSVKNIKNRSTAPFTQVDDIKFFFEYGIDPLSGLLNILVQAGRIKPTTGKAMYEVCSEYLPEGETEYKFKAIKADNRIDSQVLLACPKLVDGTKEQIEEYLTIWGAGMRAFETGDYEEKTIVSDGTGDFFEELESENKEE